MKQNQQSGMFPFPGGFPGQRESSKRDIRTELVLVRRQTGDNIVLWTGIFLLLFAVVLVIGPVLGYIAGIVTFAFVLLYGYAIVHNQKQPVPALAAIIGLSLLGFWMIAGYPITDRFWWTIRCNWEPRNKLALVIFLLGVSVILFFNMYRFAYEVVDPNSQPTISPRDPSEGIRWPWSQIPQGDGEVEQIEVIKEVIREVPRPVPTNGAQNVVGDLDAQRVDATKTVIAPSGREVSVKDLIDFVKFAPICGATFRPWKKRKWKHNQWKDVISVWQIYGVVSANGERTTTELIVTDLHEALRRLSSAFVDDSPTPQA